MNRRALLLTACLMLALAVCGMEPEAASAPVETKTPAQVLEEQPPDDTHDAFLVETGG